MKEKKARVEDALHATRAAVEEGIVPGGGVALLRAAKALQESQAGRRRADRRHHRASAPARSRCARSSRNSGTEGAIVVEKIRENENPNYGFNAATEPYEDLVKAGVIDPTKVTRSALQNAASIASLMLTTEAMIAEIPEKKRGSGGRTWRPRSGDGLLSRNRSRLWFGAARGNRPRPLCGGRGLFYLRRRFPSVVADQVDPWRRPCNQPVHG